MSTPSNIRRDGIAVLDFGGQYVHLIATKIRSFGVYAEIRDPDDPLETFHGYQGIILSGSPALSAFDADSHWTREVMDLGVPVLGFCFGHQEIAKHSGGEVEHTLREYGPATLHVTNDSPVFAGLSETETVWMSHGDTVTKLPPGFVELGYSTSGADADHDHRFAAMASEEKRQYGFQFHPEVDDTEHGLEMIKNFAVNICGIEPTWSVGNQLEERCRAIREEVGDNDILLLASGGVDSTVAALLYKKAIGPERLRLLHIDNGLMRLGESEAVGKKYAELGLGESLSVVDATREFLDALEGLTEPESKRTAIGNTFIDVFEREAGKMDFSHALLGQGTIYPDTIETGGSKRSDTIKTHHNRVPLVEAMIQQGKVSEPLKDLYKTEVRELGRALGLDLASIDRHPFPGPGLGIRVACFDGKVADFDSAEIQEQANQVLAGSGIQALPLPVKSVGVKADLRSYEHPILISGPNPGWDQLTTLAAKLAKSVQGINRCLYLLSPGTPTAARGVKATVTADRLNLLRQLDHQVMTGLERHGLMKDVWQCPTVLVPLSLDGRGKELVVVRPIHSERAMTAKPAWIGEALAKELVEFSAQYSDLAGVAIDITTKPPATIEWE